MDSTIKENKYNIESLLIESIRYTIADSSLQALINDEKYEIVLKHKAI